METKICFVCETGKNISDFYTHPKMPDGYLNKCKSCCKEQASIREKKLRKDPEWSEKERTRHRKKYYDLNYKEKHKPSHDAKKLIISSYKAKYREKYLAKLAVMGVKPPNGFEKHHWSYNKEDWKDILFIPMKDHYTAHRFMIYDQERMMYRTLSGELLDTRKRHENYINDIISKYSD